MSFNEDWETVNLSDISEIVMGQSPKGDTCNKVGKGMPLLNGPTEFGNHYPHEVQYTEDPKKIAKKGDILFCVRGSTTGRMNWADKEYSIGRGLAAIRSKRNKKINTFIKMIIEYKLPELLKMATGSTFPNVTKGMLYKLKIKIPPLEKQNKISEIFYSFDNKIKLNDEMNKILEEMAQAIYKRWFVDFEPFQKEKFVESELGMIPEGWKVKTLKELAKFKNGINYSKDETGKGTFKIVNVKNITRDNFLFIEKLDDIALNSGKAKRYSLEKWDTVISRSADPGKSMLCLTNKENLIHSGFSIRCRPQDKEKSILIFNLIQGVKKQLNNYSNGTIFKNVNQKILKNLKLIVPPDNIIVEFNNKVLSIYQRIINNEKENQSLKELRDSLLPKLMSGEIRVPLDENEKEVN